MFCCILRKNTRLKNSSRIGKTLSTHSLAKSHKCIQVLSSGRNKHPSAKPLLWGSPFVGNYVLKHFQVSGLRLSYSCFLLYFCTNHCSFILDPRQDLTSNSKRQKKVLIQHLSLFWGTVQLLDNSFCNTSLQWIHKGWEDQRRFY